jgi:hypothetical protein
MNILHLCDCCTTNLNDYRIQKWQEDSSSTELYDKESASIHLSTSVDGSSEILQVSFSLMT